MSLQWFKDGNSMVSKDRKYCVSAFKYKGEFAYRAFRLKQIDGLGINDLLAGPTPDKDKCFKACEDDAEKSAKRSTDKPADIAAVL